MITYVETKKIEMMNCQRIDILIRLLFIDNYLKKNNYGFDFYKKMDQTCSKYPEKFIELIESFKEKKFDPKYFLTINKNYELYHDGAHRLACSIYFKIDKIPVKIIDQKIPYNNWYGYQYINNKFNVTNKNIIIEEYNKWINTINGLDIPIDIKNNSLSRLKHIIN